MRRPLSLLVTVVLALGVVAGVGTPPARAAVDVVVIDGRGWGHGVGLAQDGAYWMGIEGASTGEILGHFYPGTQAGQATGPVRVVVVSRADGRAEVTFPDGGEVRSPLLGDQHPGFPVPVGPGETMVLRFDGAYHAEGPAMVRPASAGDARVAALPTSSETTTTTTTSPVPALPTSSTTSSTTTTSTTSPPAPSVVVPTTQPPAPAEPEPEAPGGDGSTGAAAASPEPLWAVSAGGGVVGVPDRGARYRGVVEAVSVDGSLRLVNHVDVEDYLRGMGEVRDPRWPAAGLEAQAIAARTYALRAMAVSGQICDTQRCQVYLGQQAEYAAMDRAVTATRGVVLLDRGRLALAFYSANAGGHTATPEEGFGGAGGDVHYLRAAPYLTRDPRPWQAVVATDDVAARLGYPGRIRSVRVVRAGPSGRAMEVELDGDAGVQAVPGRRFAAALGLLSNLFTVEVDEADEAPPPPPPADEELQASPDDIDDLPLAPPPVRTRVAGTVARDAGGDGDDGGGPDVPAWATAGLVAVVTAAGALGIQTLLRTERSEPPADATVARQ